MSTDQKATRESLLAEFKTARDAAIAKSQMGMEQIAQRHRQERADALKNLRASVPTLKPPLRRMAHRLARGHL
jgi:hypothetical protein